MRRSNRFDLGKSRNMLEFLAQHLAVWKAFRVGHQTRAHRANRLILATPFLHRELTVPLNQIPSLGQVRGWKSFTGREVLFDLRENPGRTHSRAANHRAGDASLGAAFRDLGTTR